MDSKVVQIAVKAGHDTVFLAVSIEVRCSRCKEVRTVPVQSERSG